MDRTSPGFFFSKKAQKELFYLQLKRVDHSILLLINYKILDLRLDLCISLTKVSISIILNTYKMNIRLLPQLRSKQLV